MQICIPVAIVRARTISGVYRILVLRGLDFSDLSEKTGLNVRTLHNVASGTSRSTRARHKIEAALGQPIWTTEGEPTKASSNVSSASVQ